ncbi:MAG: 4Fe-4S dicluster domain-containing protein [Anaerolineales bacterium]|nr:4Fe-4S dicluster domain-containing protein [Anaerolineales bacterium]
MKHTIAVEALGAQGAAMARAVEKCVHCGFCLPSCPTYGLLGEEMDSPRGRITLMKSALEGTLPLGQALPYVDRCLGCLGCVTACPSGVAYGELLTSFRALAEPRRRRDPARALARWLAAETLPYPARFRLATRIGRLARPLRRWLPPQLRAMVDLAPALGAGAARRPTAPPLPARVPAEGQRRARVALLAGCVQQVLAPELNWDTVRVLARCGVEVIIPPGQGCCGALLAHTGEASAARRLAARNLRAFPTDVDAVITNAAGCGSGMGEYGLWFAGRPEEAAARALAARVQDVCAFLAGLDLPEMPPLPRPLRLAYHDACHLAHAQGVTAAPRTLLGRIPNLTLIEVPDGDLCCGSAGTYNLEQPEIAARLGRRKAQNLLGTGAEAVAAGNIGCLVQIDTHLRRLGRPLPLYHTVQVLAQSLA